MLPCLFGYCDGRGTIHGFAGVTRLGTLDLTDQILVPEYGQRCHRIAFVEIDDSYAHRCKAPLMRLIPDTAVRNTMPLPVITVI